MIMVMIMNINNGDHCWWHMVFSDYQIQQRHPQMMQILHWVLKMIVDPLCQWHSSQQCPISSPNSLSTAQSSPNHTGFPEKVNDINLISNGQPSYSHIVLVHTYSLNPCSRWNFLHKLSVEASQQPSHPRLRRLHDSWYKLFDINFKY